MATKPLGLVPVISAPLVPSAIACAAKTAEERLAAERKGDGEDCNDCNLVSGICVSGNIVIPAFS
jgi:hypothetical protein